MPTNVHGFHRQLSFINYETALNILERFANTRQAAVEYLDALIGIKRLDYRSATDVMPMYSTICNCLAELRNLGFATQDWSLALTIGGNQNPASNLSASQMQIVCCFTHAYQQNVLLLQRGPFTICLRCFQITYN